MSLIFDTPQLPAIRQVTAAAATARSMRLSVFIFTKVVKIQEIFYICA
jgi:hypothetical protein